MKALDEELADAELSPDFRNRLDYVLGMERALMLFEIGNGVEGGSALLADAAKMYQGLQVRFPDRVVVKYRRAKVVDALKDRASAIALLRELLPELERDQALPPNHWLRSAAPRFLGVLLGEQADEMRELDAREGADVHKAERRQLIRDAYEITRSAYGLEVEEPPAKGEGPYSERAKAANNLLWYALEYLDEGGDQTVVDLKPEDVTALLEAMQAGDPTKMDDPRFLDTARRAYLHVGDLERARGSAQRLLDVAKSLPYVAWGAARIIETHLSSPCACALHQEEVRPLRTYFRSSEL